MSAPTSLPRSSSRTRRRSTVLRVPTTEGDLYFKAVSAIHLFEAALTGLLAELQPGRVPEVVAMDARRGWLLMRDGVKQARRGRKPKAMHYTHQP